MASFIDAQGQRQQVDIDLSTVRAAADNSMSLREHINRTYETNASAYGDAFSQMCASEGIVLTPNKAYGIRASSLDTVLNGPTRLEAGVVTKTPNQQARVLMMPAIGALVEDKLLADLEMNPSAYDSMVAYDQSITDDWLIWPQAKYSEPEAARSQQISQGVLPPNMLTLTTSEKSIRVPTFALGIEWSEQATKYLGIDFIALSITRQALVEKNERANADLLSMLLGDPDIGMSALSSISGKVVRANTLDTGITTAGTLTQAAWMKFLYRNGKRRKVSHVVTDINGALAIENRTGRPTVMTDNNQSVRINAEANVLNPMWNDVDVFITDDPNWPANTIMAMDSRFGIHRVTSTNASYQAQENFVLKRSSAMRFDYGTISKRMFDDAFDVLELIV